jgi:hypothetical protein
VKALRFYGGCLLAVLAIAFVASLGYSDEGTPPQQTKVCAPGSLAYECSPHVTPPEIDPPAQPDWQTR